MSECGVISGPYFPVFSVNTGKYGPEITPYLDTFVNRVRVKYKSVCWRHPVILDGLNPFQVIVVFHIETSWLICTVNKMTGFNMKCSTGLGF